MSVLRYPGGKTRAIKVLETHLPKNINVLYSPFFGGGSFELFVNHKYNVKVYANDKFEPLYNFWKCLKEDKDKLVEEIKKLHPITKTKFTNCKKKLTDKTKNDYERAACYFAINRSSFSGSTMSGGFSEEAGEKRFTMSSINKASKMDLSNIEVSNQDFTDFIPTINDGFIFMDPPYYLGKNSKLYGDKGDLHEGFDHDALYNLIKDKKNWILCYNNCDYIKQLYKDFKIVNVDWKYGMNKTKESSEILIFNLIKNF